MTNEERKENTYIGSAEIRFENTERRDRLVKAAEAAGFLVDFTEAIGISFSGANTPVYWAITVYAKGRLAKEEQREARARLAAAWRNQ